MKFSSTLGAIIIVATSISNVYGAQALSTTTGNIHPTFPQAAAAYVAPSAAEIRRLHNAYLDLRETITQRELNKQGSVSTDAAVLQPMGVKQTLDADLMDAPGSMTFFRNVEMTLNPSGGGQFRSALGEPNVYNRKAGMFFTGNTFAGYSANNGSTWTQRNFPPPPRPGYTMCCDQVLEFSESEQAGFWALLWLNASRTHGFIQIAVLRNGAHNPPSCHYNFNFGAGVVPDYPKIAESNDFLWIATNNVSSSSGWVGSQVRRYDKNAMRRCATTSGRVFTYSGGAQRVFTLVNGATDTMYWGMLANTTGITNDQTRFRVFRWPENSNTINWVTRNISTSRHFNPDCRGGVNNADFLQRTTSYSAQGFRMRGAVGQEPKGHQRRETVTFLWNASPGGGASNAHIRGAVFETRNMELLKQPHIFNNSYCMSYPDIAPTERGYLAVNFAYGGRTGGRGLGLSNAVLLADDFAGPGPFGPFSTYITGTHNPTRYGDYLDVNQYEPGDSLMIAGGYVYVDGTSGARTRHQVLIFGRNRDIMEYRRNNTGLW